MDEQILEDVANRLAPKYRSYLLGKSKGTNLKAAEKAVLDQVKNDAFVRFQPVEAVVARIEDGIRASQTTTTTTTTTQPAAPAAPAATPTTTSRQPGQGSAQGTRTFTPTSSPSAPTQVTSSRVPGEGSARGELSPPTDQELRRIAMQLQPKFANYLLDPTQRGNLDRAQTALLDAVRTNPSPEQLDGLYRMTRFDNSDFMVREMAFGSLATLLGVEPIEARSRWERLTRMTPTTGPGGYVPEVQTQYSTSRVPGEGSRRGGDLTVMPATGTSPARTIPKSKYVDAVIDLMGDDFRNWYLNGDMTSLTAAERTRIGRAMADPNNIDFEVLAEFADVSEQTFVPTAVRAAVEIDLAAGDAAAQAQQTTAQNQAADAGTVFPYYNPRTSQIEYLTDAEAKAQGLQPPTAAQRRVGATPTPSVPPAATTAAPSATAPQRRVDTSNLAGVTAASGGATARPGSGGTRVPTGTAARAVREEMGYPMSGGGLPLPQGVGGTPAPATTPTTTGGGGGGVTGGGGGATGGGGGGVVTMPATEQVDPAIPQSWEEAAAQIYPEYYAILRNNPEIADLLRRSIGADGQPAWSEAKFAAELRGTNWYKTTSASAREWDTKSALDPATYQAMVDEVAAAINAEALNYGIRLSSEQLQKLSLDSQRLGFGKEQVTNAIGMLAVAGGSAGATQLREGFYGQQVRTIAADYGITLNDTTFNQFVNKIAVGEESLSSFQDYALTIAKSMFPSVADQFDAGRTFTDITAPFRTIASNLLEIDENEIDFRQPQWAQALTYQPDPKTGEQRLMNMREWQDYLRNTDSFGYQYTTEARSRAYGVAETLANMFGRI